MSLTLAAILAESAARYPSKDALILGESRITYAQLWDETRRYAAVLRAEGVRPGDKVALLMPNVPDFPRVYYAALSLGAVVVPVHALLVGREIAYVLRDSGATMLVAAAPLLEQATIGAAEAGVRLLATMGGEGVDRLDLLAADAEPIGSYVQREPEDPAVILYTSGTTGSPKGAVLTHLNMTMNAIVTAMSVIIMDSSDVVMAMPAAVPLVRPDLRDERRAVLRGDPGAGPAVRRSRRAGPDGPQRRHRVRGRADDVHRAAGCRSRRTTVGRRSSSPRREARRCRSP